MSTQQQQLSYDTRIEKYDEQTGDLYMRAFGIADGLITSNNWLARNVAQFGKSLIKKWVVDQDLNPKIHRKFTNLKEWLLQSEKAAIGTIEDIDVNEKTGALDIIYKVTDSVYKEKVLAGKLDKRYSSPAIWGYKLRRDPESGLLVYDEWEGVHVALVKIPAFPKSIAQINDNICVGGIKCANELAAVASSDLENFTSNMQETDYKPNDKSKMSGEEGNRKTVPYEEYIGLKNNSESKLKELESKYNEAIAVNKKISETKETVETKYKELETKWTEREKEDRKKSFSEKLSKIFEGEELDSKVKFAVEKNYSDEDIDQLYGPLLKKAEEEENQATAEPKKNPQLDKAGIASSSNSSKMDNKLNENVELALSIANQRRRVF